VLSHRGSLEEAERLAREAVDIGERTGWLNERGYAWTKLGEVLRQAGREQEARDAFTQALDLYERKGNLVSAGKVREELRASARSNGG